MGYETGIPFLKIIAQLVNCDKKDLGVAPGYNRSEAGLTEQETADKIRDNLSNERKPVTISWPLLLYATNLKYPDLTIPIYRQCRPSPTSISPFE